MFMQNVNYWQKLKSEIDLGIKPYINGIYVDYKLTEEKISMVSPIDGSKLLDLCSVNQNQVNEAVKHARASFEEGRWTALHPLERKNILLRFASLIERDAHALAIRDAISMGKPVKDCLQNDITNAATCFRWFAETIDKSYGQTLPAQAGVIGTITKEPLGVVACITPWNYPMENVAWKLAPALAAGNSVLLKPAEQATLSACYLGKLATEAGIPAGVFNILPGSGGYTGKALGLHNDIDGIFFTGSTETGKKILQYAGSSNLKKVALECGGKSAFIVLESCNQLSKAASILADRIFSNQGQTCSAPSRLIIEESIHEKFLSFLLPLIKQYQPQDPLSPQTTVGAMVSHKHLDQVLRYVESGLQQGATLLVGGKAVQAISGGAYMEPTIFDDVKNDMVIAQEEIFGPVLSIIKAKDANDALRLANQSKYGLAASVWSDDITVAHTMAQKLKAGTVYINAHDEGDITAPFGGFKESGSGSKDKSLLALDQYSAVKTLWLRLRD